MSLVLDIFADYVGGYFVSNTAYKVAIIPKFSSPKLLSKLGKLLERFSGRYTFHDLGYLCRRISWRHLNKDVNVVFHYLHRIYYKFILLCYLPKYLLYVSRNLFIQYSLPIFRYPHQMVFQIIDGMVCPSNTHAPFITAKPLLWQNLFASPYGELLSSRQQAGGYFAGFSIN